MDLRTTLQHKMNLNNYLLGYLANSSTFYQYPQLIAGQIVHLKLTFTYIITNKFT